MTHRCHYTQRNRCYVYFLGSLIADVDIASNALPFGKRVELVLVDHLHVLGEAMADGTLELVEGSEL